MNQGAQLGDGVPVAIVGAGPVGLSLALGLARYGVRSTLVEKKAATSRYSKAPGVHVRTREILRRWGVEDRFLAAGTLQQQLQLHNVRPGRGLLGSIDFRELDVEADRPGILIIEQGDTERLLLEAVRETGLCDVRFDTEATALRASSRGAALTVRSGGVAGTLDAAFVAGCDGAGSFVRQAAGLPFEGRTYALRPMLADVRIGDARDRLPWPRYSNTSDGLSFTVRLRPTHWRVISLRGRASSDAPDEVSDEEVLARTVELLGPGPAEIVWSSRFRIHLRSSPVFRKGRVVLAGDAAHIHSPAGGQGMNAGMHDADNLAWKLAAALGGGDVDRLLDSYDVERRAVAVERVSRVTDVLTRAFILTPELVRELGFFTFRRLMQVPFVRRRILRAATMIDLHYPASPILDRGDRAAGVRLPNPLLQDADGRAVRLHDLLPAGAVLLKLGDERGQISIFDQERRRRESRSDPLVVSLIRIGEDLSDASGVIRALVGGDDGWILVRPDSHVAWARRSSEGLDEAVRRALGSA